jgi:hypothetical protein
VTSHRRSSSVSRLTGGRHPLLQSNLDPVTADKVTDLRNMFQDAYTGWLEVYKEAA